MTKRIWPAALALALLAMLPLDAALARGGGDGGGGFGGGGGGFGGGGHGSGGYISSSGRGVMAYSRPKDPSDQQLFDRARSQCNGPQYPSGATPLIDYDGGTFSCFEPASTRH